MAMFNSYVCLAEGKSGTSHGNDNGNGTMGI